MSISGYIVEKYNCMSNSYTCSRLLEEAKNLGVFLEIIGICDTLITHDLILNANEVLPTRDFVINRYKYGKEKDAINQLGMRSYNALEAYNIYINKYEQVKRLRSTEFLIPNYMLGTAAIPYCIVAENLGMPIVAKGLESSMGKEVILIKNKKDYDDLIENYSEEKEWLFEEFIKTSFGRDLRFYSIRGNVIACMCRKSQGDFRANVALGASVEPFEITDSIRRIAKDIYEQTGLDFLGIDLMFGVNQLYFCEINVMPGLEGIEKASGVNIAREVIKTIKGDFGDE